MTTPTHVPGGENLTASLREHCDSRILLAEREPLFKPFPYQFRAEIIILRLGLEKRSYTHTFALATNSSTAVTEKKCKKKILIRLVQKKMGHFVILNKFHYGQWQKKIKFHNQHQHQPVYKNITNKL